MPEHRKLVELVQCTNEKITAKKDPNKPYVGLEHIPQRGSEITEHSNAGDSISTNSVFQESDVLFGKLRPNLRKCVLAKFAGYCSTDILVLRALPGTSPSFAVRILQSEQLGAEAEKSAIGTKMPRTSWASLRNIKVFAPAISEQQKIAQILNTLDTQIQKTEALIAKLEKIKEGLLHDLLTRGIDQNGQLRPTPKQAPQHYKESALGLIPKDWEVLPAEAVCEAVIDCKNRTPPERTTGFPVIRTPNVRNGRFVYSDLLFTDRKSYEIWTQRGAPRPGDIVITREAPVGEVCKIPTTMKQACLGQRMMMYQPDPSIILTDYMLAALVSRRVQNRLLDLAGGSTVGHVKVGDIRQLAIPTPPVSEQALIAESFNSIESRLRNEAHELEKLRLEKNGLMDDLLSGHVRVTSLLKDAV
ncbi:restriction endonuclease subunit S [Marinobacter salarius]|uniref:restriction endonuclease subunit S n=1 Tax=Marinobacter salarius TaxID=1420917 RepID=UPI000F84F17F|nr:restriction endonuclease subunit S [Marinobacter salarius]AZR42991.1 type I site-specific deoxyribonuclease [Marinobacter salarius]